MAQLEGLLLIPRCPFCQIDNPNLVEIFSTQTNNSSGNNLRYWKVYRCNRCGGLITASADVQNGYVNEIYPIPEQLEETLPPKAKEYLKQAVESIHAPAGAIMLCASSVDSMLKEKGLRDGSLYLRIDKAVEDNLITQGMADWAHEVRLDANDQRHADDGAELPNEDLAKKCIDFTLALGQFLFVLPARVARGIQQAKEQSEENPPQP